MKTINHIAPPVSQMFDADLLSIPIPVHDEEELYCLYQHIKLLLQKKIAPLTKRDADFLRYEREFLDLYEQIKKEKNKKTENRNLAQGPFYWHSVAGRRNKEIFERLTHRVQTYFLRGKNNALSKVYRKGIK